MNPSIYHVKFSSITQSYGEGLAVFKEGSINGGDVGYLYIGTFTQTGTNVIAKITVKRWNTQTVSVFGPIQEFDLDLRGEILADMKEFNVSGFAVQMPGMKIMIQGRWLAAAK